MDTHEHLHICLAVCGGIAAYKAIEVMRLLQKADCEVRVCMTEDATRFVGPTTFEALSGREVLTDLYTFQESPIGHVDMGGSADAVVVVPATANVIAKIATGITDDALTSTILAAAAPKVIAAAMNVHMWMAPSTQRNVAQLQADGCIFVDPDSGMLACGYVGTGKLATPEVIAEAALKAACEYHSGNTKAQPQQDLEGMKILVTAGPTHEKIDAVRYIANMSTGKMGFALAAAAQARGAEVVLVAGPVQLETPQGVRRVDIMSARELFDASTREFLDVHAAICTAAVADWRPKHTSDHKMKKGLEPLDTLEMEQTEDTLAALAKLADDDQVVIGFAAETDHVIDYARKKILSKHCDMIVANDVSKKESTFGSDTNKVSFVFEDGEKDYPVADLQTVSNWILDELFRIYSEKSTY